MTVAVSRWILVEVSREHLRDHLESRPAAAWDRVQCSADVAPDEANPAR
jgi:hypothetical protein